MTELKPATTVAIDANTERIESLNQIDRFFLGIAFPVTSS
jgi:hypothetical protein